MGRYPDRRLFFVHVIPSVVFPCLLQQQTAGLLSLKKPHGAIHGFLFGELLREMAHEIRTIVGFWVDNISGDFGHCECAGSVAKVTRNGHLRRKPDTDYSGVDEYPDG
ncbi:MAG: hypothetical protein JW384_02701 [Nitrosomonadaceae bacterium]|nr:hypothetical protein [Nitrosomonadaceae bacterium]